MTSGEAVRAARDAKGWTQQELAQRAGLAYRTVSTIENGGRVRPTSLRKAADALELDFASLQPAGVAS